MEERNYKYRAFISYSHKDGGWANWLHKKLETYRIPRELVGKATESGKIPSKLFPVFRDRDELSSSSDLGGEIEKALRESESLVVICSPNSAQSKYVNEEVRSFKVLGREKRMFCLIVDGEPNADESNSNQPECFGEAVKWKVGEDGKLNDERAEPIAADAREGKDGKADALLKVIAGILGVGLDELKQRELQRRQRRLVLFCAFSFLLVLILSGLTGWALKERTEAVRARDAEKVVSEFVEGIFTSVNPRDLEGIDDRDKDLMKLVLGKGASKVAELVDQPMVEARIRNILSETYSSLAIYEEAKIHLKRSLELHEEKYSPKSSEVGLIYGNLGLLNLRMGLYIEALRCQKKSLEILSENLGVDHSLVATSHNNLGGIYNQMGRYMEASKEYKKSLLKRRRILSPFHPSIARTINNLGVSHMKMGRFKKALDYFNDSFEIKKKNWGDRHPEVATTLANIGGVYAELGEFEKATEHLEHVFLLRSELLGDEHPETGKSLVSLGVILTKRGKGKSASVKLSKALAILEKTLGENHAEVALCRLKLGLANKDYDLINDGIKKVMEILGEDHPDVLIARLRRCELKRVEGELEDTLSELYEIETKAVEILGEGNIQLARIRREIAHVFKAQTKWSEALNLYNTILPVFESEMGVDQKDTIELKYLIAKINEGI